MEIQKICEHINEFADEEPKIFGEFFYDDIRNYLGLNDCPDNNLELNLKDICGTTMFKELTSCKNEEDIKKWLDKISGYIIMNLETENIIAEYFSK